MVVVRSPADHAIEPRRAVPTARPAPPRRPALAPRLIASVLAGVLLYLAFPPAALWWLAPPAVAAFVLTCRGATPRCGALLGLVFGLALFLPLVEWTRTIAGLGALIALALLQASFHALLGAGLSVATRARLWPLWAAGLWVLQEALRARLPFGGFPWGRLAFSQGDSPLTPLAAVGGAPFVTFVVALVGAGVAWSVVRAGTARAAALAVALGGVAAAVGAAALVPTPSGGQAVQVAVVQGNVPRLGLGFNEQRAAVLDNHVSATRTLAQDVRAGRVPRPDLVLWPENASDLDPFTVPAAYEAIDGVVRELGVPLLVGAVLQGPGEQVSNAGIVWDPVSGPGERYVKRHPVPFGEYIPYRSLVRRVTDKVDLVPRDFAAGDRPGVLQVGPARLGDVICFEVAYDDLVRDAVTGGGRLLVVQTNNATFGRSGETVQQLAMGRLRAVEHGRSVLVAATSGISAVITPDGRLQSSAPVFGRAVLSAQVPLRDATTLATRLGALPELAVSLLGLLGIALGARRRALA